MTVVEIENAYIFIFKNEWFSLSLFAVISICLQFSVYARFFQGLVCLGHDFISC